MMTSLTSITYTIINMLGFKINTNLYRKYLQRFIIILLDIIADKQDVSVQKIAQ